MTFGNKLRRITLLVALLSGSASVLSGAELLETAPKEVGLRADRLSEITRLMQRGVEKQQIAGGVVMVLRHGKIAYREAIGYSDAASKSPMRTDHLFRIASMTKPVTAVAIMMLRDEGQLDLSDPVSKYIPEFAKAVVAVADKQGRLDAEHYQTVPARREITIQDLLTHTSGVTYPFFGQEPQHTLFKTTGVADGLSETSIDVAENAKRIAAVPLVNQPGEAWQYGLSTDVLGRVVEIASGQSLAEFFRQRIFEPLKMSDTHFFLPEEKISRLATLYRPGSDKTIEPVGPGLQTLGPVVWSSTYQCEGPKTYFSGGGGLVSSINDYAIFLQMMLQGGTFGGQQLLAQSTVTEMTKNQIGNLETSYPVHGKKCGYGFGVADKAIATGAPAGSYSWGGAFHTFFWVDPKNDLVAILMTQLFPAGHLAMRTDFQRCVYDAIADNSDRNTNASVTPGSVYREYATHNVGGINWRVTDPDATAEGAKEFLPNPILSIEVDDLKGAIRAEALLDRWGGHLKTTDKQIRFNGNDWIRVPEISTTPSSAEYYYSQDNPVVEVPLHQLHEGKNSFEGTCAAIGRSNWGQWGLNSLILRVYYDPEKLDESPTGHIVSPQPGATLGENPRISVDAQSPSGIAQVDVLGWYDGYDDNGDGHYLDWHRSTFRTSRYGVAQFRDHIGTALARPYEVLWDTRWVPDQKPQSMKLLARVKDGNGFWLVTEIVDRLSLARDDVSVVLYHSTEVPEGFGARVGERESCILSIPDSADLSRAHEAVLPLRTWHGLDKRHEPLKFNDYQFAIDGNNHLYDFDMLSIPVKHLRNGDNRFEVHSNTVHHMIEILWPGPALLVRYDK